MFSLNPVH